MIDQIVSIETIERQARAARARGQTIEDHGPNWHSAAHAVWVRVYAELAEQQRREQVFALVAAEQAA